MICMQKTKQMKEGKKKGRKITHLSDILGDYQKKKYKI